MTRVDIHCENMNFSLTEQQVPMFMRLALLGIALHGRELRPEHSQSVEHDSDVMQDSVPLTVSGEWKVNQLINVFVYFYTPSTVRLVKSRLIR